MNRRLAAILAADVVGYSALMAEDEAGTLEALRRLRREVFRPMTGPGNFAALHKSQRWRFAPSAIQIRPHLLTSGKSRIV